MKRWTQWVALGLLAGLLFFSWLPVAAQAPDGFGGGGRRGLGVVVEVGPDHLVIQTARGTQRSYEITASAHVKSPGGQSVDLDDIQVGQWVMVTERHDRQSGWVVQTIVVLPEAYASSWNGRLHTVGRVSAVDTAAGTFSLARLLSGDLTLQVTGETMFTGPAGGDYRLETLQVGQTVAVMARQEENGQWTALNVFVMAGHRHFAGEVTAVETTSGTFSLLDALSGAEVTFKTDEQTQFNSPDASVTGLASLQPGMMAGVQARLEPDGGYVAQKVIVSRLAPLPLAETQYVGRIAEIGDDSLSLLSLDGQTYTFLVTAATTVRSPIGREGSLSDLRVGLPAAVGAVTNEAGDLQAVWVLSGGFAFPGGLPEVIPQRPVEPGVLPRFITPNDAPRFPRVPRRWVP